MNHILVSDQKVESWLIETTKEPQSNSEENESCNIPKDNFSAKDSPPIVTLKDNFWTKNNQFIFTPITPQLFEHSNNTCQLLRSTEINKPLTTPIYSVS